MAVQIGTKQYTFFTWGVIWRIALALVVLFAIFFLLFAGTVARFMQPQETAQNQAQPVATPALANPDFNILLAQTDSLSGTKRLLYCGVEGCEAVRAPDAANADALFDGESWYYYETIEDGSAVTTRLRRSGADSLAQTIVEETELVKPRGLAMSPDGSKVAYWLDNIADDEGLTELWVYDAVSGGTRVVAEKLVAGDVLTRMRWNSAGTLIWFIADSGTEEVKQELITVEVQPVRVSARFLNLDWSDVAQQPTQYIADIRADGSAIAVNSPEQNGNSALLSAENGRDAEKRAVRGNVSFLEWSQSDTLIYVAEFAGQLEVWAARSGDHNLVASLQGTLEGASASDTGGHLAMIVADSTGILHTLILDIVSGEIYEQTTIPKYGSDVHLVQVVPSGSSAVVAGVSSQLSDGELIAFVDRYASQILDSSIKPVRLITTDGQNEVLVDAKNPDGSFGRYVVVVRDAIHPEWEVLGRYQQIGASWQRIEGVGPDPEPKHLYEWEEGLNQWILKESY